MPETNPSFFGLVVPDGDADDAKKLAYFWPSQFFKDSTRNGQPTKVTPNVKLLKGYACHFRLVDFFGTLPFLIASFFGLV